MRSPDITAANIDRIAELFPTVVTESTSDDGNVKRAIDFDLLRQELSDHVVDGPQERYQLDWPGKREALFAANAPIAKTLRPDRAESVNFDTTKNVFIEGDNLDALKLLQESYLGKVKLIYIDPPYNTGKDFVYHDAYAMSVEDYLSVSGQSGDGGGCLISNPESNGRFHSDWLSMIYPRLKLARNLLADDGLVFISIDDNEHAQLRSVCNEVFGERNFVAEIAWQHLDTVKNDAKHFSENNEYILVFARSIGDLRVRGKKKSDKQVAYYKNSDGDPRGAYLLTPLHAKSGTEAGIYEYIFSTGQVWRPPAGTFPRFSRETLSRLEAEGRLYLDPKGQKTPQKKTYLSDVSDRMPPTTFWSYQEYGSTRQSNKEVAELVGKGMFQNPKPTKLIQALFDLVDGAEDAVVVDFFAGSGSTAHAVMALNAADGGTRRWVLVQLAEPIDASTDAAKAGFSTISEITRKRLQSAGQAVLREIGLSADGLDVGFRTFTIDTTNMADTLRSSDRLDQDDVGLFEDSVKPGRTSEDLLFQVMLDWGLMLDLPIEVLDIGGHEVHVVDEGALVACFAQEVSPAVVEAMARLRPLRAVFRDSAFQTDAERINVEQVFAQQSPDTKVKTI